MNEIMTVKATTTLYIDFEYKVVTAFNPKGDNLHYKLGEDYSMICKGSLLDVYYENEYRENSEIDPNRVLCVDKRGNWVSFKNMEEMAHLGWFTEVVK